MRYSINKAAHNTIVKPPLLWSQKPLRRDKRIMWPTNAKKNSPVAQNSTSCVDVISFGVFSFSSFSLCDFMLNLNAVLCNRKSSTWKAANQDPNESLLINKPPQSLPVELNLDSDSEAEAADDSPNWWWLMLDIFIATMRLGSWNSLSTDLFTVKTPAFVNWNHRHLGSVFYMPTCNKESLLAS